MSKLPSNFKSVVGDAADYLTDSEWLYHEYIVKCRSTREIAASIGCGKKAVTTALHRYAISIRIGVRDKEAHAQASFQLQANDDAVGRLNNREWLTEQFLTLNRSKPEIASELSTSVRAVDLWLRKFDLKNRKDKPAQRKCSERRFESINGYAFNSELAQRRCMRGRKAVKLTTCKAGEIWCHSSWEIKVAKYLDQHPAVSSFCKDVIRIKYYYDDRDRWYYPDFLITLITGEHIVVEVKADRLLGHPMTIAKLGALHCYAEKMNWKVVVVSGKSMVDPSTIFLR